MAKPISVPYWTLLLLCFGYFIDFYDLTIFSSSYAQVIPDLFQITQPEKIQQTYLTISNIYTLGILAGSAFFGLLADKIGRSLVIKISILVYSLATFFAIFCHNLPLFMLLRFLAGFGLATEFATSSVLISELFSLLEVPQYMMYLYLSGILGGMCATYFSIFSWKILFLFGGCAGLFLFIARKKLVESPLFLHYHQIRPIILAKSLQHDWFSVTGVFRFCKLLALILPYNLLIALMFIFPSFMSLSIKLSDAIHQLLFYFFIGNIISTLLAGWLVKRIKRYNDYLWGNTLLFGIVMLLFPFIDRLSWFIVYSLLLGLLGGGLPTLWMQIVVRHYPTTIRSTAANLLFAAGRVSMIGINLLIAHYLTQRQHFILFAMLLSTIVTLIALLSLLKTQESYTMSVDY